MTKNFFCIALAFSLCLTFSSCKSTVAKKAPEAESSEYELSEEELDALLGEMTVEEKIAQMLVIETENGAALPSPAPGGVILFEENFKDCSSTKEYIYALKAESKHPLIISVDQEGGRVQRLKGLYSPAATKIPPMYDLGKTGDSTLAFNTGRVMAEEMAALGINVTFAPVLDIYSDSDNTVIGTRSFGEDAETVSSMALSLAKGLESGSVMPVFKHFPGHGDTSTDSHHALPVINIAKEQLYERELVPFKAAISQGAEMIMVGHIALPKITGNNTPATLSKEIITDLLISEMGFNGLVITDALNMGALTENYSESEIYKMAVEAGADLLLMPNNQSLAIKVIKENFSEERINQSVKKILKFKYKYLTAEGSYPLSCIGSAEHKAVINKIK